MVDLGTLAPGMPAMSTLTALTNGAPMRFIARGQPGNTLRSVMTPSATGDIRIDRLDLNEVSIANFDTGGLGAAETLAAPVGAPPSWVGWSVSHKTVGSQTDVTVATTATAPRPYVITTGTLPFVDACTGMGATNLGTGLDDQVIAGNTLPMPFTMFRLFGDTPPSTFRISANGWLSFDTAAVSFGAYQNRPIPTGGAPNGLIAPFWQDQDTSTICRKDDPTGNTVTIQWAARLYQQTVTVQYQVVLHADGVIDFIYGPNQMVDGSQTDSDGNGATVGLEDLNGLFGHQVLYNQPGVLPNTSRTFTPM